MIFDAISQIYKSRNFVKNGNLRHAKKNGGYLQE